MKRTIFAGFFNREQFLVELKYISNYLATRGYEYCEILFGAGWGTLYYPNDWLYEKVTFSEMFKKINTLEEEFGRIGEDDFYIKIIDSTIEFLLCHEGDIHLSFDEDSEITEHFFLRWKEFGYSVDEWELDENNKRKNLIRNG